jgi:multiple sugar transport system substrate-binding protein
VLRTDEEFLMSRLARLRAVLLTTVLVLLLAACGNGDDTAAPADPADEEPAEQAEPAEGPVNLTIAENAVRGGKNTVTAEFLLDWAIPTFEERMADEGREVSVELVESGVDDEDYKAQLALDLSVGEGADLIGFDQFWLAEFAAAGYLQPLEQVVGPDVNDWEGWEQIPDAVAGSLELDDQRYGIPIGTDGRVLFYRTDVFEEAGLPDDWQSESWEDVLEAARTINEQVDGVTPLQLNAGTAMGEATTLQGFVPVLLGTGAELHDGEAWIGDTPELREALQLYDDVYAEGLADAQLQVRADGRDRSFEEFSQGQIAMLIESDYLWRGVIAEGTLFPLENREEVVGWTLIPAREPGAGIRGQDHVSASGGTGRVLNPNTQYPLEAWELLSFLGSEEALTEFVEREPRITAREDVNETATADDEMLQFIAEEALPITWYRPGFEEYPQVSELITRTVENVVADRNTVEEAAQTYQSELEGIVGADNVRGGDG